MTKLRWTYLNYGEKVVEMTAWRSSAGDIISLPQRGDTVRHGGNAYTVKDVCWTYDEGLHELPTEIVITLLRWGTP